MFPKGAGTSPEQLAHGFGLVKQWKEDWNAGYSDCGRQPGDCVPSVRFPAKRELCGERSNEDYVVEDVTDCLVKGDKERVIEVLQNIMENAIKYGDGRQITIAFSEEEDCRLVSVVNTGSSIPEAELVHIFDSFYRGSNADHVKGSGLGLYICRSLMHRMDGEVFAEQSEDGFLVTVVIRKAG